MKKCKTDRDCVNDNKAVCCRTCLCKTPKSLDQINTECIFVEKVFDVVVTSKELQARGDFIVDIEPAIESIKTINVECKILDMNTFVGSLSINGFIIDTSTTIPGPGGEQIVLSKVEIKNALGGRICPIDEKGTKVSLIQEFGAQIFVEVIVTGTGLNSLGQLVNYTGTSSLAPGESELNLFDICIPLCSPYPISMLTSLLPNCNYAFQRFNIINPNRISVNGEFIICVLCENKVKVPAQICALTTGPCIL